MRIKSSLKRKGGYGRNNSGGLAMRYHFLIRGKENWRRYNPRESGKRGKKFEPKRTDTQAQLCEDPG